jgi:hypothetical protein
MTTAPAQRADAEDEEDDMSNAEPSSARTRDSSGFRGGRGARGADAAAAPLAGGLAKKAGANAERRFSSKFYGVSWHKSSGRWAVQIRHGACAGSRRGGGAAAAAAPLLLRCCCCLCCSAAARAAAAVRAMDHTSVRTRAGGKRIHVGYYSLEGDAARAYDDTARRLRGGGTKTNFSEDGACLVHGAGGGDGSEGETAGSGGARDRTASWPTDTADGGVAEPAHATTEACTAVVSVRSAPPPGSSPGKPRPPARKRPRPLAEASGGGGGAYDSTGGSSVRSGASDDGMPAAAAAPLGAWALAGVSSEAQCTAAAVAFFKRERTAAAPIAWRAAIIRPRARGGVRCVEHAIFA